MAKNSNQGYGAVYLFALLLVLALLALPQAVRAQAPKAYLATVRGPINPVVESYLGRVISTAEASGAEAVIIALDTPGGLDSSMRAIIQRILASRVPVVVYVYPPGARAGSAGTYITYAAHVAAMAPNSNIGSATPVALGEGGEQQMSPEMKAKVVNDAVAFIRGLAQQRGRNADWAEKAVREGANLPADEAAIQGVVDLVAKDIPDLLAKIDSRTVRTVEGDRRLRTQGAEVVTENMNLGEEFLYILSDPNIAYILLSLGMLGIFFELSNPGAIFPGVLGGIFLLMAFYGLGMLPVNWVGVLLIALAFVLFIADLFVTSHGVLTVGGLVAFLLGSLVLINTASAPYLAISLPVIVAVAACVAGFFIFAVGAVWRARRRKVVTGAEGLVGSVGEVRSPLNPTGLVLVQGELWKATSIEGPIEAGEQVVVTAVDGLRLSVKRLPAAEQPQEQESQRAVPSREAEKTGLERPPAKKGAY